MKSVKHCLIAIVLAAGAASASAQPASPGRAPSQQGSARPLPRTRADAEKWLRDRGLGTSPEALGFYLTLSNKISADAVRVYLLIGASANRATAMGDYPLNALAVACDGQAEAAEAGEVLLQAGANPNQMEADGRKASPAMAAVMCPDLLKAILARKPNLNVVDANGLTAMHYAIQFGKPRDVVARMIKDAGFDMARWRSPLLENYTGEARRLVESLLGVPPPAAAASAAPRTARPATPAPPTAVDWKALAPYPTRSESEAIRLLARPGVDMTPNDHFWDGITHREPQRLALALQAGASVKQLRAGNNYTPLMLLAEFCDVDRDVDAQVSIAEQLIGAGADVKAVHSDGWTALILGADDCPLGVVRVLVNAGSPLQARQKDGITALQTAILDGRADVVDLLLDAGLDPKKEPYNVGRLASGNKAIEAALKKKRK